VVAGGGEVALVGRDAEPVDLGVWVWDGARADATEGFPEALFRMSVKRQHANACGESVPDRMVIAGCRRQLFVRCAVWSAQKLRTYLYIE
jgi:hypothetical protein